MESGIAIHCIFIITLVSKLFIFTVNHGRCGTVPVPGQKVDTVPIVLCLFSACGTSKQKRKPSSEISTSESKKVKVESTFGRAAAKTGGSPKGSPRPQEGAALPATDSHPAPPLPLCKQHRAACVKRTVVKAGPNKGRLFYACSLPRSLFFTFALRRVADPVHFRPDPNPANQNF